MREIVTSSIYIYNFACLVIESLQIVCTYGRYIPVPIHDCLSQPSIDFAKIDIKKDALLSPR